MQKPTAVKLEDLAGQLPASNQALLSICTIKASTDSAEEPFFIHRYVRFDINPGPSPVIKPLCVTQLRGIVGSNINICVCRLLSRERYCL